MCREVVIIDRGRVVAAGETAAVAERLADRTLIELRCRGPLGALRAALLAVPGVAEISGEPGAGEAEAEEAGEGPHELRVRLAESRAEDGARCREELARAVLSVGELQELRPARSGLEAVFRWLTAEGAP